MKGTEHIKKYRNESDHAGSALERVQPESEMNAEGEVVERNRIARGRERQTLGAGVGAAEMK